MSAATTNLQILKRSTKRVQPGDVFVLHPDSRPYLFGRVIRTNATIGPIEGILIYIYKTPSSDPLHVPTLRRDDLLIPPVITNRLPWSRGYFQTVLSAPLTRWDTLTVHCFKDIRGYYFDDSGHRLSGPIEPVGQYGLHSFRTIDDAVSDALGIPRA